MQRSGGGELDAPGRWRRPEWMEAAQVDRNRSREVRGGAGLEEAISHGVRRSSCEEERERDHERMREKGDMEGEEEGDGSLAGVDREEVVAGCLRLNLAATRGGWSGWKNRGGILDSGRIPRWEIVRRRWQGQIP